MYFFDGHIHMGLPRKTDQNMWNELSFLSRQGREGGIYMLPINRSNQKKLPDLIKTEIEQIEKLSQIGKRFKIITNLQEFKVNAKENVFSFLFGIEYFNGIFKENLTNLKMLKDAGIKYITLIPNQKDNLFVQNRTNNELTDWGKQIISEMNRLEIKIGISHLNEPQILNILRETTKPVIASHSCTKEVSIAPRNLSRILLRKLKLNQALILIKFTKNSLYGTQKEFNNNAVNNLIDHIEEIITQVGINHVGIGSDMQEWGHYNPKALNQPNLKDTLVQAFEKRGYSKDEIKKIMFANILSYIFS